MDGYKTTNAVHEAEGLDFQPRPQSPQMTYPRANETDSGDDRRPGASTPSSSSLRATDPATPKTPSSNRSRFMKSTSTPQSAAAAVEKRNQARMQAIAATIAKSKADAAAGGSASSSFTEPQPAGSRAGGGFTPKPSTPIFRRSYSNTDTTSADFEYDNDVEMDRASNRGETTPNTSHISENLSSLKRQEGRDKVSIDEEGSPRKRARGSEVGVHGDDGQEDNPFSNIRARPLFPQYGPESESPSQGSTVQVEVILAQPSNGIVNASSSGPSTSHPTTIMGPPPTTPRGPKTPSSTHLTTDSHIMNLESLTEHLRLLERRRTAAERQSEIRQSRIQQLEEENNALKLQAEELMKEVRRLKAENDDQNAKIERCEDQIVEALNENRRLKGKAT